MSFWLFVKFYHPSKLLGFLQSAALFRIANSALTKSLQFFSI